MKKNVKMRQKIFFYKIHCSILLNAVGIVIHVNSIGKFGLIQKIRFSIRVQINKLRKVLNQNLNI